MYKPLVMSNEEYHGKKKYESSSTIRKALNSPKKYLYDKTAESVPTKAMEEGTAVHTYFLENELFKNRYCYKPKAFNGRTKEGKQWMEEHGHLNILAAEWEENLIHMNHSFLDSPAKMIYDLDGLTELSYFSEDLGGIRAKCRPDWISNDSRIVVDLKTTQDASPKGFQKSIGQFGYHIQGAWYLRVLQNLGFDANEFIFIAIEKTAPFCVGVYRASTEMIEEGSKKVDEAIEKILWCKDNDSYPDYTPNEIETISLPPWMTKKKDQQPSLEEIELY
tara:strand:+ start:325 stop:1155 length:831 start_codon:yes stop_codon:yes gene_type:complete